MRNRFISAMLACLLLVPTAAVAQSDNLFESALSFKGQTLSVPGSLGSLRLMLDCDPKNAAKITLTEEHVCHLLDGARYEDVDVPGLLLSFYDLSLLPGSSSDNSLSGFIKGKTYFDQVLAGDMNLAAYGMVYMAPNEQIQQHFLPPMTRETSTLALSDIRILKVDNTNVGVAYVAAESGSDNQEPYKVYLDFVFKLPNTKLLGVYSMPLVEANMGANSFSKFASKQVTATPPAERIGQLGNALDTYVSQYVSSSSTYNTTFDTVQMMLATAKATPFIDVFSSTDFAEAILALRAQGFIQGYADGSYKPGNSVNRAEFMKILLESSGVRSIDAEAATCFPDVDKTQWYAKYVCYGKKRGIIAGYSDGSFRPESNINMAEALKIIFNTYQINTGTGPGEWYQPFLDEARRRGMLVLITTRIGDNVTRGEMAELMYRLLQSL